MSYLPAQPPESHVEARDAGCQGGQRLQNIRRRLDVPTSELELVLITALVVLSVLVAAGTTVVGLFSVLPSLVLAIGLVAVLLRLIWFVTCRGSS